MPKFGINIFFIFLSSVSFGGLSPTAVNGLGKINKSLVQAQGLVNSTYLPPDVTINFIGGSGAADFLHSVQALNPNQKKQILGSIASASSKIQDLLSHPESANAAEIGLFKSGLRDIKVNDEGILIAQNAPRSAIDFLDGKFNELLKLLAEKPNGAQSTSQVSGRIPPTAGLKSTVR